MNPSTPAPDIATLAAQLRLAAAFRRRIGAELAEMERFATGLVVLAALRRLPALPPARGPGGRRPLDAPVGFARNLGDDNALRAMKRVLFPRMRDLRARLARFDRALAQLEACAARVARRIERLPASSSLIPVAPRPARLSPCVAAVAPSSCDTS
jgi:hypothetical protein